MKPLQIVAYEYLKDRITNDELEYGKIYSETQIARELNISRTPMRDAIQKLAQEKYLDIIPSKGFTLHQITSTDVIETFQVRSAIEGYCTMQIAQNHKEKDAQKLFTALNKILQQQKKIMETSHSVEEFVKLDNQFHLMIVGFLKNSSFDESFSHLIHQIKRLAIMSLSHEGRMEETYQEHFNIFQAMKDGDVENIYKVTLIHMEKPKGINLQDL